MVLVVQNINCKEDKHEKERDVSKTVSNFEYRGISS